MRVGGQLTRETSAWEESSEPSAEDGEDTLCPECGSARHVKDHKRGEIVCSGCGLVIEDRIMDPGPEWRGFDAQQILARQHTGDPVTYTLHDKGLSTVIDPRDRDAHGSSLASGRRRQIHRLRRWDRREKVSDTVNKNLIYALSELDRIAGQLQLPRNVREAASLLYRQALERGLIRGMSIESCTASAIYIACRQFGIPRTLKEIAEVTRYRKKEIARSYLRMTRGLGIHLPPVTAIEYIPRFTSRLSLPGKVGTKATEILREVIKNGLSSGKSPPGLAGAAVYLACILKGFNCTQEEIGKVSRTTPVTLRNRCKEIAEYLDLDV